MMIAPYYSVNPTGRTGFPPPFVQRVRRLEFPHFFWERLPVPGDEEGSMLRIDHLQPIGHSASACEKTKWRLTKDALDLISDHVDWFMAGRIPAESLLASLRQDYLDLDA
jgi:hypothetical protein